ncbi:hypothetical protein D6777_01375 [Candidatus Woesearchaeota archaeon]|nr:MAG: hypothetical protein D6777_01375 [Candidatus Woesearchaeota archaeon]
MLEDLLTNPEKFRAAKDYRATYKVFPVEYKGKNYIVKKTSLKSFIANHYYTLLDKTFFDTRVYCSSAKHLAEEANKLNILNGHFAPRLIAYKKGLLIKEYIYGASFRQMNIGSQRNALESIIQTVQEIHSRSVTIGDAHVKNYIHPYKWIDFDGKFKSLGSEDDKALDLLKLIYSTYITANTKDFRKREALTYLMAYDIKRYYKNKKVLFTLGYMLEPAKPLWKLWLNTRIPRDGLMLKELRKMFR